MKNIVIIGSGALGSALANNLALSQAGATISVFARNIVNFNSNNIVTYQIDYHDEKSVAQAAEIAAAKMKIDLVLVTTGILHDDKVEPEKSLNQLATEKFHHVFAINTFAPAIIAKYFIPKINRRERAIFAVLSARVGSISDNKLGGWYAYRASKAALNMIIKNIAIETKRTNKNAIIVALHPGTVDSYLSKPYQKHIAKNHVFTPEYAAEKLLSVLASLNAEQSGNIYAWDGEQIQP